MLAATNNSNLSAPSKHDTAKKWLHRRLWKPASRQLLRQEGDSGLKRKLSLKRPQTAPTSGRPTPDGVPPVPQIPINFELPSSRLAIFPPPRPPRPDSGVVRDVNAWLDASMTSPPRPLMGGLPYWRAAAEVPLATSTGVQYAIPIVSEPVRGRPSTPSNLQVKSFCRRAKKMQVKMPSLLRTTSQRIAARKQIHRRSNSMPILAIPYEQTQQAASPKRLTRSRSFLLASSRTSISKTPTEAQGLLSAGQYSFEVPHFDSVRTSRAYSGTEGLAERRTNAQLRQNTRSGESTRLWTAGAHLSRDDSMGDLSEAPTYSSGRPPPSYRSRTASVITTSSFGCVDGMSPTQRLISQQRAITRTRGVRGRVKELRKMFQNE